MRLRTLLASVLAVATFVFIGCGNSSPSGTSSNAGAAGLSSGGAASCATLGATHVTCGAACVDTATDSTNCGTCGKACGVGTTCQAGVCSCTAPLSACTAGCVNTQSDTMNCGACGTVCPTTAPFCSAGLCSATCALTQCTNACVNTMTDPGNCGACGTLCGAGQSCAAGICTGGGGGGGAGAGGSSGAGGGSSGGASGSGGAGSRPAGCPAAPALLSDFEEGSAVLVPQGNRSGWWYVFADTSTGMQTPPVAGGPIAVAAVPAAEQATCNKYALHSTASGHPMYVGFGATLKPTGSASNQKAAVDIGAGTYTGVSFKIRAGTGTTPVWFEFLNKETQPGANCTGCGGDLGGTATNNSIDAFNTRGRLLNGPGAAAAWQIPAAEPGKVITVPFATLAPRYLPGGCDGTVMCEAPAFNAASTLGLQYSVYSQFATTGSYDLWVDDVTLTTGDAGLPTLTQTAGAAHPFPRDAAVGTCAKPTGALGKYLIEAYQNWKSTFVVASGSNLRVQRPESGNDSVSEGIAYGMLIAVYMNDKTLFDGLWGFWKSHSAGGPANAPLMDWKATSGNGSAVDADEDAAFALVQAGKQWTGGTYATDGVALIKAIFSSEVEAGTLALKPGNNFGGNAVTNPSYFAPAYYRVFAAQDSGDNWAGVISKAYTMLKNIEGSNGIVPAWCTNGCASAGSGGLNYANETDYQYDSHRTPWRIGLDACWNANADAQAYVTKTTGFFASQATNGIGRIADIYQTNGTPLTTAKYNSMSIIGTAGAGALYSAGSTAAHKQFLDRAWRFLIDASYTPDPTFRSGPTGAYTYYNATVGLLTALTLSGNFNSF